MKFSLAASSMVLLLAAQGVQAATIDLSGQGYVTYGDGLSYSMPIYTEITGQEIMAGPGQINVYTKLGLGANGQLDNGTAGIDDAFDTPQANTVEGFRMGADNEPDSDGNGDRIDGAWDRDASWDASLSALDSKLNFAQNSLVFFFANNETGGDAEDNLAAWARIEVSQISTGVTLGLFELTNDWDHDGVAGYGPPPIGGGIPMGDPTLFTSTGEAPVLADFIMSGGNVCINAFGLLVDCSSPDAVANFEHNLGGDRAAYAIIFPELDALIAGLLADVGSLDDYAMHVEYRLGCGPEGAFPVDTQGQNSNCDPNYALNGGDEKVFIGTQYRSDIPPPSVPEPGVLALFGLGLLGIGMAKLGRRRA